ncbi:hypothetical protein AHF37_04890 [Paragonimus kellicotti]|nr:hypothetical protein AHF37_04890 [Paragonimus kellicotti]
MLACCAKTVPWSSVCLLTGHIRTLVCTATLAWGVNLPAHAVIIKGTRVYKAEKSDFVELDILDVLQIFGRAGRPQFDTQGVASIITSIDKMDHYLRLITNQHPIESSLLSNLNDHLNAEIALGTVTNIDDAVTWLKDTYLFVRLMKNPLHYGIQADLSNADSTLSDYLGRVVRSSALDLDAAEMIRYEPQTGQLASTDRGRTASLFYIRFSTAAMVRDTLEPTTMLPQLFSVLSEASEFVAMKVRDEEGGELNDLKGSFCRVPIQKAGNVDSDVPAKVNALLQGYISRHAPVCHSLASDMNYIHQNAGRLVRYLFELSLRQGWSSCASTTLQLARMIEQRQWDGQTPLWQFAGAASHRLLQRVDEMELSVDRIRETGIDELSQFVMCAHLLHFRGRDGAREVSQLAALVPRIQLSAETQPITRTILRVRMTLEPDFTWSDRSHGTQQNFWIWIEDPDQGLIYHSEYWTLTKRTFKSKEPSFVVCTIPLFEPFPTQYLVRVSSDQWLGADTVCPLSFKRLLLPPPDPPHTAVLLRDPLLIVQVVELTGDVTPDIGQLMRADLIVTTPEKWDGISRSWQQRVYVRHIGLIIIDEIHLLGEERGPVLEVIVCRGLGVSYSQCSYYGLEDCQPASVSAFLSGVISDACNQLVQSSCLEMVDPRPDGVIASTALGRIASYYYLSHKTMRLFADSLKPSSDVHALLQLLANAHEYDLLPVRHNEDEMNRQLATMLPLKRIGLFDCPHTKTHLLLQAHFTRLVELPVADYVTDTRSVLDQAPRIVQAMLDVCAQCGWLATSLNCLILMQMLTQGVWVEDVGSSLLQLPGIQSAHLDAFRYVMLCVYRYVCARATRSFVSWRGMFCS